MTTAQLPSTRLVAHAFDREENSAVFADAARFVLDRSGPRDELRIVSPYLGAKVLARLVAGHRFRLVTDLDECFNGRAAASLEHLLAAHHEFVRHRSGVHAKLLASSGALMLGSANLTRRGFAERDELAIVSGDPTLLDEVGAWFEQLWQHASSVDPAALERARAAAERSPRRTPAPTAAASSTSATTRGLGWLAQPNLPPDHTFDAEPIDAAVDELAATIRQLVDQPSDGRLVLGLFREALLATGLSLNDKQLHMGFGLNERRLHITVGNRYVIWAFPGRRPDNVPRAQPALGFIAADVEAINDVRHKAPTQSWDGWFKGPRVRTVKLCVSAIRDWIDVVRPVWLDAIAREVDAVTRGSRPRTSSFLRARRGSLDTILRDQRLIDSTVERAFGRSTPTLSSEPRSPRAANLAPPPEKPHAKVADAEVDALAETLLRWVQTSTDARFVLELFREALLETGLSLDDQRLNSSFALKPKRIHLTVGNRYVLWGFAALSADELRDKPAIGFIMAEAEVVDDLCNALPGEARSAPYTRPEVPGVIVALSRLREVLHLLRPSWLAAVRNEVSRGRASPGRRALRPSFDAILRDTSLFEQVIERTKR